MSTGVQSIISTGSGGVIVDIECNLSNNLPNIIIVGLANKAVDEARERIRGSFATSHIMLPRKRVTINLAPADIPKADSGFDLAIAVAILLASGQVFVPLGKQLAFIGELGLNGSTRAVRGIIGKLLTGRAAGITTFFIPAANLQQAQLIPQIDLVPIDNLAQLHGYLDGSFNLETVKTGSGKYIKSQTPQRPVKTGVCLSEVVGQELAKRALEIAAAGGHNVFFSGPPGTGKSMLAKALPSVLPPLNREEVLEVTQLHSLASHNYEQLVVERPYRAPHHSASHMAILGGGSQLRPGEISLAHRGILFLDELPEFKHDLLEALRQPLEDHFISLARARSSVKYPANFVLVATGNPCPCGYYGSAKTCICTQSQVLNYRQRLSGPILDRIDLYTSVHEVNHDKLLTQAADPAKDNLVRDRIARARQIQSRRFSDPGKLNADMTNAELRRFARLEPAALQFLNAGAQHVKLSARGYMRAVKVARTIADLDASVFITVSHMSEALSFRPQNNALRS